MANDELRKIALAKGEAFAGGGNRPIRLDDPDEAWYVAEGAVDLFVAQRTDDDSEADFKQLLRRQAGELLFGIAPQEGATSTFVAKGLPGSELRRLPLGALAEPAAAPELVEQVDSWVAGIAATIARGVEPRPRSDISAASADEVLEVAGESVLTTRSGVAWARTTEGSIAFLDDGEPSDEGFVPLTPDAWGRVYGPAKVALTRSGALHDEGRLLPALAEFHRVATAAYELHQRLLLVDMANMQRTQAQFRHQSEARARANLFDVLSSGPAPLADDRSALAAALELVGGHESISFRMPARPPTSDPHAELAEITRLSSVRSRNVQLAVDDRWWLGDSGAMLAFRRADGAPVALLPSAFGRYRMVDPSTGRARRVDAALAEELYPDAHFFYRPFPRDAKVKSDALLRFAFRGLGRDFARFGLAGVLVGILMLTPPILLGALVDRAIPSGSGWLLAKLAASLVFLAVLAALLQMMQGSSLMRMEALAAARLGAAVWDRLIGMPQRFFRRFSAGDLTMRGMAFQQLRDQVSGVVAHAILSVVFLLPTFILLFLYDTTIGWLGIALGVLSLGFTLVIGILQLSHQRSLIAASQNLAGRLLQLLIGIGKLRATGSEGIAFALWARIYRDQKRTEMRLGNLNEHLIAFLSAAPLLAAAAVFATAVGDGGATLATGDFLTVYAAFMVFYAAVAQLGGSFSAIAAIIPAYEQVTPILENTPEIAADGESPPQLSGEVRLDHLSFRYSEDAPLVLRDVSIHARAGQFVALVGESGAGKSTLFRLALGLETPQSGTVYYDGRDLSRLNKRAVRSRVGMVVQDASLQPGSVMDNIIGMSRELTEEDAWAAARLAAVDEDIAAMPMQMHTPVSDAAALFSGGQVQRIMVAAALARDPTVLFLDEATNWLDNKSQAQVMESVRNLAVTRFVSAHRLSTIREADNIYVLQDGRVAQQGTFDELVAVKGPFQELVRRQMA